MKSFFPYLALVLLFLAGIRLVKRQQHYTRSIRETTAASFESGTLTGETKKIPLQKAIQAKLSSQAPIIRDHKPLSSAPKR